MRIRPWWMGVPVVWSVWLSQAGAQVAPLAVTLHAEAPCPAPHAESPLLRLPTGCPAPWAGVLYTEQEHTRTRADFAALDSLAIARGNRADVAEQALVACRVQRDDVARQCVVGVARIEGRLDALSAESPPDPPSPVPWAVLSGGLAAAGSAIPAILGRNAGEVIGYSVAGAAVGTAVAWMVSRWAR